MHRWKFGHRSGTFAPTFAHLPFLPQDQFHYYPSSDPFADYTPGLQSDSIGQSCRLTNAGVRTDISM